METILVVDDEADIRTVVRGMLTAKGYVVFETSDPQEALRMAEQQPVHLLLTDVVMPLMKGTELAQRLRARSPWTKVLLMSAYKVSDVTASGLPFIAKPFSPDALSGAPGPGSALTVCGSGCRVGMTPSQPSHTVCLGST